MASTKAPCPVGTWWAVPLATVLAAALGTAPAAAQPVLDWSGTRSPTADRKPTSRHQLGSPPAQPKADVALPEPHGGIDNFRFVASLDLLLPDGPAHARTSKCIKSAGAEPLDGTDRAGALASPSQDCSTLGNWNTWGQFAVDLTGVTQALRLRDAWLQVQRTPPLQYQTGCAPPHAAEHLSLPPLALTLVPLAATPFVGLALIRVRRAIEPHLQARLARRRQRRAGRTWRPPVAASKRSRRPRRSGRARRRVRFEANGDPREGDG